MIIEYSTMCMTVDNYQQKIDEAYNFLDKHNIQFGIQIHNSISKELYDLILPYGRDFPLTVHSPVLSDYFLNLACNDYSQIQQTAEKAISYVKQCNSDLVFFHGFFMADSPIHMDMKNYRKVVAAGVGKQYTLNDSFIMNPAVFDSSDFQRFCQTFQTHYHMVKQLCESQGLTFALENDFVGVGSGLQRPEEILTYIDNLLFDIGHFWTSSLVHKFDYLGKAQEIIASKNLVGCHIQRNLMPLNMKLEEIRDSHTHVYAESVHPVKQVCKMLFDKGLQRFTLEIRDGDLSDIKWLLNSF